MNDRCKMKNLKATRHIAVEVTIDSATLSASAPRRMITVCGVTLLDSRTEKTEKRYKQSFTSCNTAKSGKIGSLVVP